MLSLHDCPEQIGMSTQERVDYGIPDSIHMLNLHGLDQALFSYLVTELEQEGRLPRLSKVALHVSSTCLRASDDFLQIGSQILGNLESVLRKRSIDMHNVRCAIDRIVEVLQGRIRTRL